MPVPQSKKLAFDALCVQQPALMDLYKEACAIKDDASTASFCAHDHWYGYSEYPGLKKRLARLVGWDATLEPEQPGMLASQYAYDIAYDTIYEALPSCRNCGCC